MNLGGLMNEEPKDKKFNTILVGRRSSNLRLYAIQKDQSFGRKQEDWCTLYWKPPFILTSKAAATRRLKELRDAALIEYPSKTDRLKFRKYRFVELIALDA